MNHQVGSRRWLVAEDDVPGRRPVVAAAPVVAPKSFYVVLFALFGTILCADHWATAYPAKTLAPFLEAQVWAIGFFLFMLALAFALRRGRLFHALREPLFLVPVYLVQLVPQVASMTGGWEGGWMLGIAGAAGGWRRGW
jgi:hypothetical protein